MNTLKTYIVSVGISFLVLPVVAQQSVNAGGGNGSGAGGSISYSIGQLNYTTVYAIADESSILQGVQIPYELYGNDDCLVFQTPPVDLTKSFDPVNGVQDRVQLKWFKDIPEVRYSDEDAAACDIKFWPKRNLVPGTTTPTGPVIVAAIGDTVDIVNSKKFYGDGVTPREIFKWPVKFRADGANNNKRAEPNIRYEWKVRCACEHGAGLESPWSAVKIFNTPDFDPSTGIYTPPAGQEELSKSKLLSHGQIDIQLYPNPNDGNFRIVFDTEIQIEEVLLTLRDIQGKMIDQRSVQLGKANSDILWNSHMGLEKGVYLMEIRTERYQSTKRVMIDR